MKNLVALAFSFLLSLTAFSAPKYGPEKNPKAIPLSKSHDYFKSHTSPDFWNLIPYYAKQETGSSCSVATVSMLINAAKAQIKGASSLKSDEPLIAEKQLREKVTTLSWDRKTKPPFATGVSLDELEKITADALAKFDLPFEQVKATHAENSATYKKEFRALLKQNEASATDFILINYNQSIATDDSGGGGHIVPLGAYDEKNDLVLLFDVDREWYEPYWISVDTLVDSMSGTDKGAKKSRGTIYVRLK